MTDTADKEWIERAQACVASVVAAAVADDEFFDAGNGDGIDSADLANAIAREFQSIHESSFNQGVERERERCAALVRARSEEYASVGEIWVLTQVADAILTPVPQ